jgi:hypothetical protein
MSAHSQPIVLDGQRKRPLPFERPYWAGERPADIIRWPDRDEEPYALPFHRRELGEDALRGLCGFILEGRPEPDDVDADTIRLHGFQVRDPHGSDPVEQQPGRARGPAAYSRLL